VKYFVMLVGGHQHPVAMTVNGDTDDIALFDTRERAIVAGLRNPIGEARGYKVYLWPFGGG